MEQQWVVLGKTFKMQSLGQDPDSVTLKIKCVELDLNVSVC